MLMLFNHYKYKTDIEISVYRYTIKFDTSDEHEKIVGINSMIVSN